MKLILFLFCVLFCVCLNHGKDFVVGARVNNLLISTDKLVYRSFPFLKREKDYTYVDRKERIIKGVHENGTAARGGGRPWYPLAIKKIGKRHPFTSYGVVARDLSRTKAEVTLTEGGVGFTNVSLHFESERGEKLNYLILIFSSNPPTTLD